MKTNNKLHTNQGNHAKLNSRFQTHAGMTLDSNALPCPAGVQSLTVRQSIYVRFTLANGPQLIVALVPAVPAVPVIPQLPLPVVPQRAGAPVHAVHVELSLLLLSAYSLKETLE